MATTVDLWLYTLPAITSVEHSSILTAEEIERAHTFRDPGRQRAFLGTRLAGRQILAALTETAPRTVLWPAHGLPQVTGAHARPLGVSHSHSGDFAGLAITRSGEGIGLDLEAFAPPHHRQAILTAAFTLAEIDSLNAFPEPEQEARFRRMWVIKEALWKGLKGFVQTVAQIEVLPSMTVNPQQWNVTLHREFGTVPLHDAQLIEFSLTADHQFKAAPATELSASISGAVAVLGATTSGEWHIETDPPETAALRDTLQTLGCRSQHLVLTQTSQH